MHWLHTLVFNLPGLVWINGLQHPLAAGATTLVSYGSPPVHAISTAEIVSKPPHLGTTAVLATVALAATINGAVG